MFLNTWLLFFCYSAHFFATLLPIIFHGYIQSFFLALCCKFRSGALLGRRGRIGLVTKNASSLRTTTSFLPTSHSLFSLLISLIKNGKQIHQRTRNFNRRLPFLWRSGKSLFPSSLISALFLPLSDLQILPHSFSLTLSGS